MKNYILIGLGPHAKRIYFPFLEKYQKRYNIRLKLLIELESQSAKVEGFLKERKLYPEKIIYISDNEENRMGLSLDKKVKKELDRLIENNRIDGIIISTEPKAHKIYAKWALKNNISVLMDKPITAPSHAGVSLKAARQIYQDYSELKILLSNSKSKFYITCQRRNHRGYVFIKNYLKKFISEFKVPVSYIDIYHADGAWSLPHEFEKENHPYKYGYGKLMHSGYHFIDLFAWLTEVNNNLKNARANRAKIYSAKFSPKDLLNQIPVDVLEKLFKRPFKKYAKSVYKNFGELDTYSLIQLKNNQDIITTGSINLQQNSFSRRAWFDLPEDTYKGNGRVRHERVNIQVSHLLNIQVHSYQSYESNKKKNVIFSGVGNEDHFDVYFFRNKGLVGGKSFEKISFGEEMKKSNKRDNYYLGHNEKAREMTLLNFIRNKRDESELKKHLITNLLLSGIYASIVKEKPVSINYECTD